MELNLARAIGIAAEVHRHQVDKANEPYILHCLAVMNMVQDRVKDHNRIKVMIVAVLHDVLEDFDGTNMGHSKLEQDLYDFFGDTVYSAIQGLTHWSNESYDTYIERVSRNWMSRVVKIADLTHNMDPRRIPADQIVDKDFARWDKYRKALIRLERD